LGHRRVHPPATGRHRHAQHRSVERPGAVQLRDDQLGKFVEILAAVETGIHADGFQGGRADDVSQLLSVRP